MPGVAARLVGPGAQIAAGGHRLARVVRVTDAPSSPSPGPTRFRRRAHRQTRRSCFRRLPGGFGCRARPLLVHRTSAARCRSTAAVLPQGHRDARGRASPPTSPSRSDHERWRGAWRSTPPSSSSKRHRRARSKTIGVDLDIKPGVGPAVCSGTRSAAADRHDRPARPPELRLTSPRARHSHGGCRRSSASLLIGFALGVLSDPLRRPTSSAWPDLRATRAPETHVQRARGVASRPLRGGSRSQSPGRSCASRCRGRERGAAVRLPGSGRSRR